MKFTAITLAAALGLAGAAIAQSVEDTDGDGAFSMEELMVAYPDLSEDGFIQIDTDGDLLVSPDELAEAQASGVLPETAG